MTKKKVVSDTKNKVESKKSVSKSKDVKKSVVKKVSHKPNWLRWVFLLLAIGLSILLIFSWIFEFAYVGRVAWGVKVGNDSVSGMKVSQLDEYFDKKIEDIREGTIFNIDGGEVESENFGEMGLWMELEECRDKIYKVGREGNIFNKIFNRLIVLGGKNVGCELVFDDFYYNEWLQFMREKYNEPAVSSTIEKVDGGLDITDSQEGKVFDEEKLKSDLISNFSFLDFGSIDLSVVVDKPVVSREEASVTKALAEKEMNSEMLWVYEDWEIDVTSEDIYEMLYFETKDVASCTNKYLFEPSDAGKVIYVGYDYTAVDKFLNNNAWMFEDKPHNARLEMTEDGPIILEEGTSGKMVNRSEFIEMLEDDFGNQNSKIDLPVEEMESLVTDENVDKLGIKELIATGESDFSYSPANRIHNITVGADRFDGSVLAPGEEFSFTTLLGSVDAASGYLPELVIAGNETRPEYGGGLCQVSTTMYRVALDAGFEITDRSPHRYRVSYYEPAGLDATIYIPNPDLRFINDTDNYVLIEAEMIGSILKFNFYGTSDGRQVTITEPSIYNITSPPAPVYIYTSSLPAGSKVQVDTAHYGADSTFYRYITYKDGTTKEEEVFSRYQAWPSKFKVGEGEVASDDSSGDGDSISDVSSDPNNELGYDLEDVLESIEE